MCMLQHHMYGCDPKIKTLIDDLLMVNTIWGNYFSEHFVDNLIALYFFFFFLFRIDFPSIWFTEFSKYLLTIC